MGFLSDLGNAFIGKPLQPPSGEDASAQQSGQQEVPAPSNNGLVNENGYKIIPDIDVKDLRSQRQGDQLIVKAWTVNNSDQPIRIDTSYLLKQKRQHNQDLRPAESREVTLYQGPIPRDENEHNAQIAYRLTVNGDMFQASYRIDYNLESDGARTIGGLHDDGPVRDI